MPQITETFTVTTSPEVMERLRRFLALLHFNSRFGHSGTFCMELDGDGEDQVTIDPINFRFAPEVDLLAHVGYDFEIAQNSGYSGANEDKSRPPRYDVRTGVKSALMYKDGNYLREIKYEEVVQDPGQSEG